MNKFLINYDKDELLYLVDLLDKNILSLDEKSQLLRDFKDEILTYISNNKGE